MLANVIYVALGGAMGAAGRYLTGVAMLRMFGQTAFPLGVISVNIIGSFLMGVFVVIASQRGLTQYAPFAMTGFLGGFTTFSSFSLETITLIERGDIVHGVLYVLLSVGLSLGALALGLVVTRGMF